MDTTSHPYLIEPDEDRNLEETAALVVGAARANDLVVRDNVKKVTRPRPGYRITEALADLLDGYDPDDETAATHDEDGFPLHTDKVKPEDWADLTDEEKRAYVYSEVPNDPVSEAEPTGEPTVFNHEDSPNKPSAREDGESPAEQPTEPVDYESWDYADLKSAVATRGLDVEDQKKDTLVAALLADDEARVFPTEA